MPNNKYNQLKRQYSLDGGLTWHDLLPMVYKVGNVIETQFLTSGYWHFGEAISLIMAIIIMISMWLTRKVDTDPAANGKGA